MKVVKGEKRIFLTLIINLAQIKNKLFPIPKFISLRSKILWVKMRRRLTWIKIKTNSQTLQSKRNTPILHLALRIKLVGKTGPPLPIIIWHLQSFQRPIFPLECSTIQLMSNQSKLFINHINRIPKMLLLKIWENH